ncbi:hypothetical protein [Silvimonas amylolytica]|uniref:Nickel/cobalt transporter regulator n=1 Tax=Silvimonas amylolytica TaxID=449663 RepID=A0ABQ2PLH1_9NEIS|nr:hypothetical protein [Silvimonas amylolytica]GGP26061.1 hypothetical protein GCM10010971_18800 [Silvimonas amylolytica]
MKKSFAVVLAMLTLFVSALAMADRLLPANGQLGELNSYQIGALTIDDVARVPAAAIRVYGTNNLLLMPQQVPQDVDIWYLTEATGKVWKIWVLTPAELKQQQALIEQKKSQQ